MKTKFLSRSNQLLVPAIIALTILLVSQTRAVTIVNADVTTPGDSIVGVAATVGNNTSTASTAGGGSGNAYPTAESPANAINNSLFDKYLNFQQVGAGFIVTLNAAGPSNVFALRMATGNDGPERDPLGVTLEGTNDPNPTLSLNSTWTLLYNGPSGLAVDPGRDAFGTQVNFANSAFFSSYRLLVSFVRTPAQANSMQFSEIELIGTNVPEGSTIGLLAVGLATIAAVGALRSRRSGQG